MTISNLVVAEVQLPLIENVLRLFQNVSSQNSIALIKIILGQFQIVSLRNSIAPHLYYSKTFPKCVLAEIQLHLVEIILRQFQILS